MKILTLNIRHGGGKRSEPILEHVGAERPDVVVLAEYRPNFTGKRLGSRLRASVKLWCAALIFQENKSRSNSGETTACPSCGLMSSLLV